MQHLLNNLTNQLTYLGPEGDRGEDGLPGRVGYIFNNFNIVRNL